MVDIVLVEPQIPQNTGNIARTCSATGARLHLIKPLGFEITDAKLKRAGLDYWGELSIYYYEDFADFLQKNNNPQLVLFTTKSARLYTEHNLTQPVYLVFGREDKGLPEHLLSEYSAHTARLPMLKSARSLNLSNSVAVAVFEQLRQQGFAGDFTEEQRF